MESQRESLFSTGGMRVEANNKLNVENGRIDLMYKIRVVVLPVAFPVQGHVYDEALASF